MFARFKAAGRFTKLAYLIVISCAFILMGTVAVPGVGGHTRNCRPNQEPQILVVPGFECPTHQNGDFEVGGGTDSDGTIVALTCQDGSASYYMSGGSFTLQFCQQNPYACPMDALTQGPECAAYEYSSCCRHTCYGGGPGCATTYHSAIGAVGGFNNEAPEFDFPIDIPNPNQMVEAIIGENMPNMADRLPNWKMIDGVIQWEIGDEWWGVTQCFQQEGSATVVECGHLTVPIKDPDTEDGFQAVLVLEEVEIDVSAGTVVGKIERKSAYDTLLNPVFTEEHESTLGADVRLLEEWFIDSNYELLDVIPFSGAFAPAGS